ncbi:MAG: hypothetical protein PWP20_892 [Eubacteriaceae bacterium]|nr:hypothetical protein [Eubacteriaceae bacterium]
MKYLNEAEFNAVNVFGKGMENAMFAQYFNHASNKGGQILICTAGEGWYQEEGKDPISLEAGKVITIPSNLKHWHGAKADSWFSHISVEVPGEDTSNEWLEPVADEVYSKLK